MKYAKIENNIVIQTQPNEEEGFVEVSDSVFCGMELVDEKFIISLRVRTVDEQIAELNRQRDDELRGFVIDNIYMNEELIKTMAVKYNVTLDDEVVKWIDVNNAIVEYTKADFGSLIKQGVGKVETIYFRFRELKDVVLTIGEEQNESSILQSIHQKIHATR
jgi:hypothetical protein